MSLDRTDERLASPVESLDDVLPYFRGSEKPPERWRVGMEHEKLGLQAADLSPVPFAGPRGIEALLEEIALRDGWNRIAEDGHTIALQKDGAAITLEPGGQLELAGVPSRGVLDVCREFHAHLELMREVSRPFGFVWLALGHQPFWGIEDAPRMPRERHAIMRDYLPTRGALALDMMHLTGTVQANFDYASESDMAEKLRTALAVTPIVSALYANSSLALGKPSGFESRRVHIWRHTDPDRTGLLPFVFERDFGYTDYARWAFEVPMFFVVRDGRYQRARGLRFGEFVARGLDGVRATLADFDRHLTTLFPEVRLKRFIEVRGADAVPPRLACALPALWKGILYDAGAREAAFELAADWSADEREALLEEVARRGLAARAPGGRPLLALARELVAIAEAGLGRLAREPGAPPDERGLLDAACEQLELGVSPGRVLLERWEGEWGRSPSRLIEYARYC
jgi:glutamate--cysteine ligase